jgi:hypothetical protein
MSATVPDDLPACQRPGFVYAIKGTDRLTWWSIAATLASAALIAIGVYLAADACRPWTVLYVLDNGMVVFCS